MNAILATVIGLGLAAATAGGTYAAWDHWSDECPDRPPAVAGGGLNASAHATSGQGCGAVAVDCDGEAVGPWTSQTTGLVRFRLDNLRAEVPVVVCVTDYDGGVYARKAADLPADQESVIDLEVPVGEYLAHVAVSHGGGSAHTASSADLRACGSAAHETPAEIEAEPFGGLTLSGQAGRCVDVAGYPKVAESGEPDLSAVPYAPGDDGVGPTTTWALAGGFAFVVLGAVVWKWESVRLVGAGLFTRIQRSKVLDQSARNEIHELVTSDHGVHGSEIARRLDLAEGQTRYHLDVLVREKALACVPVAGRNHYFPHGARSPAAMRQVAALRSRAASRLYDVVRSRPRLRLVEAAAAAGLSPSSASKAASFLEAVDLIERRREGRTVRLVPASPNLSGPNGV